MDIDVAGQNQSGANNAFENVTGNHAKVTQPNTFTFLGPLQRVTADS